MRLEEHVLINEQHAGKGGGGGKEGGGLTLQALKHTPLPILWFLLRQHGLKSSPHTDKNCKHEI